jgi:hypothetical protein
MENPDERGWRFAPHGWLVIRASVDAELDGLTERIVQRNGSTIRGPAGFPSVCS